LRILERFLWHHYGDTQQIKLENPKTTVGTFVGRLFGRNKLEYSTPDFYGLSTDPATQAAISRVFRLFTREKDGKKVAWVKLYKFTDRLDEEWTGVVDKINADKNSGNYGGIVLDLRNNPGGYLQAAVMVASDFLSDGVVVSQESADGSKEEYRVDENAGRLLKDKMVVLVNGGSASAAEILAGALRDHNRAKLVGEKTFGKGTVQQPEDFSDGSGLHVTIARWLLPSGKNIHGEGVEPEVEVLRQVQDGADSKADNQLDKAIEVLIKD